MSKLDEQYAIAVKTRCEEEGHTGTGNIIYSLSIKLLNGRQLDFDVTYSVCARCGEPFRTG